MSRHELAIGIAIFLLGGTLAIGIASISLAAPGTPSRPYPPPDSATISGTVTVTGTVVPPPVAISGTATLPTPEPPPDDPGESDGPRVNVASIGGLVDGQTISGTVVIQALLDSEVVTGSGVLFWLDGPRRVEYLDRRSPFYLGGDDEGTPRGWDTASTGPDGARRFPDGEYSLSAAGVDRDGLGTPLTVRFTIANGDAAATPTTAEPTEATSPVETTASPVETIEPTATAVPETTTAPANRRPAPSATTLPTPIARPGA
jgi:hypothetical protein